MMVSHLQFQMALDFFCKNSAKHLKFLRCVICCFEGVLGLKVNLIKSCIYGVGQVDDLWSLVEVLGCKMGAFPFTYLGMPLGAPHRCKVV